MAPGWSSSVIHHQMGAAAAEMHLCGEGSSPQPPNGSAHHSLLLSPCPRARQNGGKVRHKRQALQDMARPLKQWLYKHRDNPYPTKTEKILLALGSQMTLVQVIATLQAPDPICLPVSDWEAGTLSTFLKVVPLPVDGWSPVEMGRRVKKLWLLRPRMLRSRHRCIVLLWGKFLNFF